MPFRGKSSAAKVVVAGAVLVKVSIFCSNWKVSDARRMMRVFFGDKVRKLAVYKHGATGYNSERLIFKACFFASLSIPGLQVQIQSGCGFLLGSITKPQHDVQTEARVYQ